MKDGGHGSLRTACIAALAVAALAVCPAAQAIPDSAPKKTADDLIEGAKLCTRYLPRHERQFGIPVHLLAAIASTESGRFHKALGLNLPWPWTINVEGRGHFYDTKEDAISAVEEYRARGFSSIDVGCMQVNLQHHPRAFANLDQAFDPAYNVAYAAQFLKKNFDDEKSWRKATADYHSKTLYYGDQYAKLVFGAWGRIINKVADARAGRPIMNMARAGGSKRNSVKVYTPMHLHDVSVARDTSRDKGVLVVRPDSSPPVVVASSQSQTSSANSSGDFVINTAHANSVAQPAASPQRRSPELSAIAPHGAALISTGEQVSHGAQIVRIHADAPVKSDGQFQPTKRVIHVGASSNSGGGTGSGQSASAGPFIFQ